jgi:hypothetical protein
MVRPGRLSIASLTAVIVYGTGCTGPAADRSDDNAPASSQAAVSATPAAFGTRHLSLGCVDAIGAAPGEASNRDPFRVLMAPAASPPPRAEDVGLRLPAGLHWYFRKNPLGMPPGAADVTASLSGAGQALAWVPASVWTSGGSPDLGPWAASSITLHSCPDRAALFLGGILAADLDTCIQLTVHPAGHPGRTMRQRIDGSPCAG